KKAGLIKTTVGKPQPALTRAPEQISLLDIFNSLDEADTNLIQVDPKTNPDCVVGGNIQDALNAQYAHFQKVVQDEMAKTTLADVIQDIATNEIKKKTRKSGIDG
ncbi:Rrf2 family transcriptional regulator, partial [Pediococcus acidilactici]|uniref:Rrf2 family transcriptional regulator n=1 Tax=Pediococcus acidilactici TaxID=1254 RepID=UPI000A82FD44